MANNLNVTPGAGASITADQLSADSSLVQVVKLAISTTGLGTFIPASVANGMLVNVSQVQGVVVVNNPTASNLKVDASGANVPVVNASATTLAISAAQASPAFVRLSDGTNPIATLPVSGTFWQATQPVSGTFWQATQPVSGTVAATQSGGWNIGTVASVTGTVTVAGEVTGDQGAPAALANGWPTKLTDGTHSVGVTTVGGAYALKVDVINSVGAGALADEAAFTAGTTALDIVGGVYNDSMAALTSGQAGAARSTPNRALHFNLRSQAGVEIGTSGAPVRVDPTGTTPQPVSGTVTVVLSGTTNAGVTAQTLDYDTGAGVQTTMLVGLALPASGGPVAGGTSTNPIRVDPTGTTTQPVSGTVTVTQGTANVTPWNVNNAQVNGHTLVEAASGIQKVGVSDVAGNALTDTNPLSVAIAPRTVGKWRVHVAIPISQTNVAVHTPAGGKTAFIEGWVMSATVSGVFILSDGNASDTTDLYKGTLAIGTLPMHYPRPEPLGAVNDVLRYTSDGVVVGDLTVWGYDS